MTRKSPDQYVEDAREQADKVRTVASKTASAGTGWMDAFIAYRWILFLLVAGGIAALIVDRWLSGSWVNPFALPLKYLGLSLRYAVYSIPIGVLSAAFILATIMEDDRVRVLDIHPLYGRGKHAVADIKIGKERWADLRVVNPQGDTIPKDRLNRIEFRTGESEVEEGFELMGYDPETNSATANYLGESSIDIRRYERMLERIEAELLTMADWGIESLLDQPIVARMIAARVTRYLVQCHAQATVPNGDEVQGMARDVLDELDQDSIESLEDKLAQDVPDDIPDPRDDGHEFDYADESARPKTEEART